MELSMIEVVTVIAIVLGLAIAVILILAVMKPATFRVERKAAIGAPAEKLFGLISDFHQWRSWSPWENRDPELKRTYSGAERGKGAVYAWDGNKNIGAGRMEILDTAPSQILIRIDFERPFEAHNKVEFTLTPQADATNRGTIVTWAMHGPAPFMFRVMQVVMNMDKIVAKDFVAGLANLRKVAEQ
jgi:uncharacterized protein YndB with AHSA1/START domain